MKPRIVADGDIRHKASPEIEARLRELRQSIRARHAAELLAAGPLKRFALLLRIEMEYRRERRRILPSPQALYGSRSLEPRQPGM